MITENNKRFLRRICFLENFTDEELYSFFKGLEGPITLTMDEALIKEGAVDKSLYIVLSGSFFIYKKQGSAKIQVGSVNKGEILGEMSEFVEQSRGVSVVVASLDAKFLKVDIKKYPLSLRLKIRENYCHILAQRLMHKNDEFNAMKREIANMIQQTEKRAYAAHSELQLKYEKLQQQLKEQVELNKLLSEGA